MAKKNLRKAGARVEEQKEFDEAVLHIDRVTRVVKGGRRLRFRVTVAIGDRKGRVGMGIGKATEVVNGIKKAVASAKRSLVHVPIAEGDTLPHNIDVKYKAVHFIAMPACPGTGVIAGGALRKILSLAGIKNVLSKNFGSRNTLVMAQAAIKGLSNLRAPKKPAKLAAAGERKTEGQAKRERRQQEDVKRHDGRPAKKQAAAPASAADSAPVSEQAAPEAAQE